MARKVVLSSGKVAYVTNIMADGTVRDSMEGYTLPYNEKTKRIYQHLADMYFNFVAEHGEELEKEWEQKERTCKGQKKAPLRLPTKKAHTKCCIHTGYTKGGVKSSGRSRIQSARR